MVSTAFLCISLVTINRQTSYDSGILYQDNKIILSLLTGSVGDHLGSTLTETSGPNYHIRQDCRGHA